MKIPLTNPPRREMLKAIFRVHRVHSSRKLPAPEDHKVSANENHSKFDDCHCWDKRGFKVDCPEITGQRSPNTQSLGSSSGKWSPTGPTLRRRSGNGRGVPRGNASKLAVVRAIPLNHPKMRRERRVRHFLRTLSPRCAQTHSGIGIHDLVFPLQTDITGR